MKKSIWGVILCVCVLGTQARGWYRGEVQLFPFRLEQEGDSVYVQFTYELDRVQLSSNSLLRLTPSIATPDFKKLLPVVLIQGRGEELMERRTVALMSRKQYAAYQKSYVAPYATLRGYGRSSNTVRRGQYTMTFRYEPWMAEASLLFTETIGTCSGQPYTITSYEVINRIKLEEPIVPYVMTPTLAYLTPPIEQIKRREQSVEAYLDFMVGKTDINPDYRNNPTELRKINDMFRTIADDPDAIVRSIVVSGYASPEGGYAANQRLSEGRANALVYYLFPRYSYPMSYYTTRFGGENWVGLRTAVEQSSMEYRNQVLELLSDLPSYVDASYSASLKQRLIKLSWGVPYTYMVKNLCPALRKAVCKVAYDIKSFDLQTAKQVIKTRPQNLSMNEMYHVANSYPLGSAAFVEVFETAVRMFPEDPTANFNAAAAMLSRGDVERAKSYLDRAGNVGSTSPSYQNALGVAAMMQGDLDQAEVHLRQAQAAGLAAAGANLEQIAKKRENIAAIEAQESKHKK